MTQVKNSKKLLCLLLSLVFAFSCFASTSAVLAAEDESNPGIAPAFSTIGTLSYNFHISGITATCSASVTSQRPTNLKIVIELQKSSSGTYKTVETWSASRTGTLLSLEKSKAVNILSDYRMRVTYTAGSEVVTRIMYDD